ncbi:MAG: glutamine-hydrolyzing carbamoyl-phosphate synthase small subunit [Nitriliruptorales bacterium]|nr:glutamine-hydrolyzing carbamoyl-phosphate synthase small subunit [Nitriliruptorales bacterium]
MTTILRPPAAPPALLVLEDGVSLRGEAFGAPGTVHGEVVFNTAITGYQEVLTDPSYRRQIVTMTAPHMGNYGTNDDDGESGRVQVAGFVVREASRRHSNHRARRSLHDELAAAGVTGISQVDTRRLTRHIRSAGAMRAAISTEILDVDALVATVRAAPQMQGSDLATTAGTTEPYEAGHPHEARYRVVAYDFGLKRNILRLLVAHGCHVTVVPATTPAEEALAYDPDGLFVSNGPGDPAAVTAGIAALRNVLAAGVPTFGICLGHQLLAHAVGASTYKMTFGHRGANQPVRNDERRAVEITSHNHGFAVDVASLPADGPFGRVRQTHVNLNDGVNEGLRCLDVPAFSVQYHPEAAPGPHDARYLFSLFTELMGEGGRGASGRGAGIGVGEGRRASARPGGRGS